ncbi:MAG: ATP synthase F1 subunit delta [candidate division Zixibacteria bacterium RBG_16_53_22]|nr:MAG: ATP synthase F1 subunit delta [candidate division Zixibacteria bacterium RBG_16_53_22]
MRETRVAHRYAHALFNVAIARDLVDIIASELFQLRSFIEKDKRLVGFLEAPQVLTEHKVELIKTLFTTRISQPLLSFLLLLIEKGRIEYLSEIAVEFEKLVEGHRGIIRARVTTAVPVTDDFKNRLKIRLEELSRQKIELVHKIDRNIIGGIIVQLNYKIIDHSIRHRIALLRHDLMAIKVY